MLKIWGDGTPQNQNIVASNTKSRLNVLQMTFGELNEWVLSLGQKSYRAKQIFEALHQQWVTDFNEITCLSKEFRQKLSELAFIETISIVQVKQSVDGTRKYQLKTSDGHLIESVFIPDAATEGRNTICISSQVGCAMGCTFCATAAMNLTRNLTGAEIVGQIYAVNRDLKQAGWNNTFAKESDPLENARVLHNIVYMGMGEPLHNYVNVVRSIHLLSDQRGQNYSGRRITVSTSGVVKNVENLGRDTNVHIAISLNATTNAVRDQIMPINKKWNIEELLAACQFFPLHMRRRVTFEYVMLAGINDTNDDAYRLLNLLNGIKCKVNLIPFNAHPLSAYKRPDNDRVRAFQTILLQNHMTVFVRTTRGDDIDAACGMLGALKLETAREEALLN
jgi:23S rRNA (adenine2503-C2)-methyltransferase